MSDPTAHDDHDRYGWMSTEGYPDEGPNPLVKDAQHSLTDFLSARIAEDEAVARGAWPSRWEQDGHRNAVRTVEVGLRGGYEGIHMGVANLAMTVGNFQTEARNAAHIALNDPARVLAECEAKRRIITAAHDRAVETHNDDPDELADSVLTHLAAVYADHPDYNDEWRP